MGSDPIELRSISDSVGPLPGDPAAGPAPTFVFDSNPASGAREASGEWLTAVGAPCQNVTIVASTGVVAIHTVAPLDFAYSLSRPKRY
jgi:hypothetical protein